MKRRVGRPPGRIKKTLYYEKAILQRLAEVYPEGLRFTDLKKEIPNPRTLTDYLRRMEANKLVEAVLEQQHRKETYRITKDGIERLLRIRTTFVFPKDLSEPKLLELVTRTLHTNITLNLVDSKTQTLQGLALLPFEETRRKIEEKWRDENFVKETCRMLHSVLFFKAQLQANEPFAKHIEGTKLFFLRPPEIIINKLQELTEKNPATIPDLDHAICFALESWWHQTETYSFTVLQS